MLSEAMAYKKVAKTKEDKNSLQLVPTRISL